MGWIWPLLHQKSDDFWINVFAGAPFLVFDVLIITFFLPMAIQWRDAQRWRETRLIAINHVLDCYEDIDSLLNELLAQDCPVSMDLLKTLRSHLDRMETAVQTALPVLNPDMSRDLLKLHYAWSAFVDRLRSSSVLTQRSSVADANPELALLAIRSNDIGLQHRELRIRYVRDDTWLTIVQGRSGTVLERYGELAAKIEIEALAKRGRDPTPDLDEDIRRGVAVRRMLLLSRDSVPLIHEGFLARLRGKRKTPLYSPTAHQRAAIVEDYRALDDAFWTRAHAKATQTEV